MHDLTFAEMFSGIGGFRLGLERSGWRCVWANDWNKYANKIYQKRFGTDELVKGDIREISAEAIPDFTLLTAGFPCQAFSVAGKRKATKESRGTLFTHIARVASAKRPKLLLLENVKGILSSESGRTFAVILRTLAGLGYLLEWQVLNSKHFGVPQNRERVFLVGHLGGKSAKTIFPIRQKGELPVGEAKSESESRQTSSTLEASYGKTKSMSNLVSHSVRSGGRGSLDRHAWDTVMLHNIYGGFGETHPRIFKDVSPTIRTPKGGGHLPIVANTVDADGYLRFGHRPRDKNGKPQLIPIGYRRIRRLTPIECERLQGFPDGWTKGLSDTQRYKVLGNAVTVNVVEFLGEKLRACLEGD